MLARRGSLLLRRSQLRREGFSPPLKDRLLLLQRVRVAQRLRQLALQPVPGLPERRLPQLRLVQLALVPGGGPLEGLYLFVQSRRVRGVTRLPPLCDALGCHGGVKLALQGRQRGLVRALDEGELLLVGLLQEHQVLLLQPHLPFEGGDLLLELLEALLRAGLRELALPGEPALGLFGPEVRGAKLAPQLGGLLLGGRPQASRVLHLRPLPRGRRPEILLQLLHALPVPRVRVLEGFGLHLQPALVGLEARELQP